MQDAAALSEVERAFGYATRPARGDYRLQTLTSLLQPVMHPSAG